MNNFLKIYIFTALAFALFFVSTEKIEASENIVFEQTPLFNSANFAPGNSVSRYIKISNSTDLDHKATIKAQGVTNEGHFGDAIVLEIRNGSDIVYKDTFTDFFSKSEISLPVVKAHETNTINLVAEFLPTAGNTYQNKTISFGLQVTLQDVESSTDGGSTNSGSNLNSGSISGSNIVELQISNERAVPSNDIIGSVDIYWNTNLPATSQVIYGLISDGPYNLDMDAPGYGYPNHTEEYKLNKVTDHAVNIKNLPLGDYVYRVVSKDSLPTISYEHTFSIVNPNNINPVIQNPVGQVLGAETEKLDGGKEGLADIDPLTSSKKGSVLGASTGNIFGLSCLNLWLLILTLITFTFLLWYVYRRRKNSPPIIKK